MEELLRIGQTLGLEGEELKQFIIDQQDRAREERRIAREEREREREREEREREKEREFELEKLRLLGQGSTNQSNTGGQAVNRSDRPKIQNFNDGIDQIDAYLLRFERFARTQGWPKEDWASSLSVLLSGRALEVYSRLSDAEANNYDSLKLSLLKR